MRIWLRLAMVPLVAAVVLAGIWAAGGLLTDDFRLAMALTALWLGVAAAAALGIAWRWRVLALPVLSTAFVTAAVAGGYLLYASSVDRVVREEVAVAASPGTSRSGEAPWRAPGTRRPAPRPSSGSRKAAPCSRSRSSRRSQDRISRLPRHRRA